jgi:murein DD-endopeptidase MepM/ murein hydrolase activator NlpD
MGKEVIASADRFVVEVGYRTEDGNVVKIDHGHGIVTSFCHLSKASVKQGSRVKRGDLIGYVGATGRSTGYHLHYAVSLNGVPINPRRYLRN